MAAFTGAFVAGADRSASLSGQPIGAETYVPSSGQYEH